MSVRVNLTISEDLNVWLKKGAASYGLTVSSFAVMLIHEAKQFREMNSLAEKALKIVLDLPAEERNEFLSGKKKAGDLSSYDSIPDELKALQDKEKR